MSSSFLLSRVFSLEKTMLTFCILSCIFPCLYIRGGVFICFFFVCVFFSKMRSFFPTTYSSTSLSDIFHLPLIFLLNSLKATNFQMLEFFKGDFGKFKEKENEQKNRCGKEWGVFVEIRVRHIFLEERNCSREFWDTWRNHLESVSEGSE